MSREAGVFSSDPFRYHSLATRTYWRSAFGSEPAFGSTTIAPYIPFEMWASTGFVPHWSMNTPGSFRREAAGERFARGHVDEGHLRCDAGGMEVDRVGDRRVVRQRHADDRLALADVDHRSRNLFPEAPRHVADSRGDRDDLVLERQAH